MISVIAAYTLLVGASPTPSPTIGFVPNAGQWESEALFGLSYGHHSLAISTSGLTTQVLDPKSGRGARVRHSFVGASLHPKPEARASGEINFLRGPKGETRTGLSHYARLRSKNLYPGIDLVMLATDEGPRYDFELAPGANPKLVQMRFEGASPIVRNGELILKTDAGEIVQRKLRALQDGQNVSVSFEKTKAGTIGFRLGRYDRTKPLLIDPMYFSTYLGGNAYDQMTAAEYGPNGTVVAGGISTSTNFPVTAGAFQAAYGGGDNNDAVISKFSQNGKQLLYCTYLGGAGNEIMYDIAVDASGAVYGVGSTTGSFHVTPATAYDQTYNGGSTDAFAFKLAPNGASLEYATYLGGAGDEAGMRVSIEAATGRAIISGQTDSTAFPTTPGSYDTTHNGMYDVFLAKLNYDGKTLVFSTFLGGTEVESAYTNRIDSSGRIWVVGSTKSTGFPTTAGAYDTSYNGDNDGFVARFDANGSALQYATFLGGSATDQSLDMDFGPGNTVYVLGFNNAGGFPLVSAIDSTSLNGEMTLSRLSANGASLLWSTYLGGDKIDQSVALRVDPNGFATVAGLSESLDYPTTVSAQDPTNNGVGDGVVTVLSPNGQKIVYSSFYGTSEADAFYSIAENAGLRTLVSGWAGSSGFPTSPGAYQGSWNASLDGVVCQEILPFQEQGTSIVLRQNSGTTRVAGYWTTSAGAISGWKTIGTTNSAFQIGGFADFNNDGHADMVQYNPTTRSLGLSLLKNGALWGWNSLGTYAAGWIPNGAVDVNRDGQPDVILFNASTRKFAAWLTTYDGTHTVISGWQTIGSVSAGWNLDGFFDVNNDGQKDAVVERTSDHKLGAYTLGFGAVTGWRNLLTLPAGWTLKGFGDMDFDGDEDILVMQTSTRKLGAYLMDLHLVSGWKNVGSVGAAWDVQGSAPLF